jgi:hypothetical protein
MNFHSVSCSIHCPCVRPTACYNPSSKSVPTHIQTEMIAKEVTFYKIWLFKNAGYPLWQVLMQFYFCALSILCPYVKLPACNNPCSKSVPTHKQTERIANEANFSQIWRFNNVGYPLWQVLMQFHFCVLSIPCPCVRPTACYNPCTNSIPTHTHTQTNRDDF